uniref:DUF4870 domain-containing protein n=1 Tax=Flavobacterium sp. TaxID=239 RepID=UPI00404B617A
METTNNKTTATLTHLSSLCQYIIPFGGFIFPLIIWSSKKEDSKYLDYHGKQVLNFQLSVLLYSLVILLIAIPTIIIWIIKVVDFTKIENQDYIMNDVFLESNLTGFLIVGVVATTLFALLRISEFFLIIYAAAKSSNGEYYKYPLTIPFIK